MLFGLFCRGRYGMAVTESCGEAYFGRCGEFRIVIVWQFGFGVSFWVMFSSEKVWYSKGGLIAAFFISAHP